MKIRRTTYINSGFTIMLILLVVMTVIGLRHIEIMQIHLDNITHTHNLKTRYLNEFRDVIRKRQVSIREIFLMEDIDDREKESFRFFAYAGEASEARSKLAAIGLTEDEKQKLEHLTKLVLRAYNLQNDLVNEAIFEPDYRPHKVKLSRAFGVQKQVMKTFEEMIGVQQRGTKKVVTEAHRSYQDAKAAMIYLGGLALGLGLLVAVFVARQSRRQEAKVQSGINDLKRSHDMLEQRVIERTEELAEARDKAMSASRAKGQFLANMSHELRTPLNAIIGYSDILHEDINELGNENLSSDISKIRSAGRHLLSLINEVLDLSKIEAGKMDMYIEQIDISEMLEDVITNTAPLAEKNNNSILVDTDEKPGLMSADLTKVRQILLNLISNASKFTENGSIKLEVKRENIKENEWIKFSILDSGIGMTEKQMAKLFSPFQQADLSTTRKYGGTGLGLTISKYFTEIMGGKLEVNSIIGEGSQFTVYIPAVVVVAQPEELGLTDIAANPAGIRLKRANTGSVERRNKVCTVLVIDDDASVRDMLTRYMSKDGFKVVTAESGMEGIQQAKEIRPDVITLDVMMPSMDGWSVLKELKNDASTAHIPIIMLSMIDDKTLGFALGATDYLTKPIDWNKMSGVIKRSIRSVKGNHVLVVEDDMLAREMTRRMLEKEGLEVVTSNNGAEALEHLRKYKPALILLDLMMPVMDGFEFMKELRDNDEWKLIPVVVLTASELSASERKLLQGSVQKIIKKAGLDKESLLEEVGTIMKTRYSERIQ